MAWKYIARFVQWKAGSVSFFKFSLKTSASTTTPAKVENHRSVSRIYCSRILRAALFQ